MEKKWINIDTEMNWNSEGSLSIRMKVCKFVERRIHIVFSCGSRSLRGEVTLRSFQPFDAILKTIGRVRKSFKQVLYCFRQNIESIFNVSIPIIVNRTKQ